MSRNKETTATITALAIGIVIFNAVPVVIGGLVAENGLGEGTASWLVTIEFLAVSGTTLFCAHHLQSYPLPAVAITGAALLGAGEVATGCFLPATPPGLIAYFGLRTLTGVGGGLLLCAANFALARTSNSVRVYAISMFASSVCTAVFFEEVPGLQRLWPGAAFLVLGAIALLALPVLRYLVGTTSVEVGAGAPDRGHVLSKLPTLAPVLVLSISLAALYAFAELIGTELGLSREQAGNALALNVVGGLGGAASGAVLNDRLGHTLPLLTGIAAVAAVALILGFGNSVEGYTRAQVAYGFFYALTMTFLMSTMASRDPSGRLIAAANGVLLIGFAVGPTIGALAVKRGGFAALGVLASMGLLASGASFCWQARSGNVR